MAATHISHRIVMIVAPAGIWRDALVSLLRAQPNLLVSAVAESLPAARDLLTAVRVNVIVIDSSVGDADLNNFLSWLGAEHPSVRGQQPLLDHMPDQFRSGEIRCIERQPLDQPPAGLFRVTGLQGASNGGDVVTERSEAER